MRASRPVTTASKRASAHAAKPPPRLFLLSPAHCNGERARRIRTPGAGGELARRLRLPGGAPLGDVFSFLSGLYFRGKLTYARAFGGRGSVLVITSGDGLRPPQALLTLEDLERYAAVSIAAGEARYREPVERDAARLARRLPAGAEVVFLGSLEPRKYLAVLAASLGDRLRLPVEFYGRGDMSRGALLLRCVREGRELDYVPYAAGR